MLKATPAPRLHPSSFCCCHLGRRDNLANYSRICKLRHTCDATQPMTLLTRIHPGIWLPPPLPPLGVENPQLDRLQCYETSSRTQLRGGQETNRLGKKVNLWQEETYPSVTQTHSALRKLDSKKEKKNRTQSSGQLSVFLRLYLRVCSVSPRGQLIGAAPQVMHSLVPPIGCPAGHHGGEKTRKCAEQPVT